MSFSVKDDLIDSPDIPRLTERALDLDSESVIRRVIGGSIESYLGTTNFMKNNAGDCRQAAVRSPEEVNSRNGSSILSAIFVLKIFNCMEVDCVTVSSALLNFKVVSSSICGRESIINVHETSGQSIVSNRL